MKAIPLDGNTSLSHKPLGVAAAAAKLLRGGTAAEAIHHCRSAGRGENGGEVLVEDVAQGNDPVTVQAAGHHRAVGENAEMIL